MQKSIQPRLLFAAALIRPMDIITTFSKGTLVTGAVSSANAGTADTLASIAVARKVVAMRPRFLLNFILGSSFLSFDKGFLYTGRERQCNNLFPAQRPLAGGYAGRGLWWAGGLVLAALAGGCHLGSLPCKGRWHRRKAMTEGCDALPVLYPRGSIMALPLREMFCRFAQRYLPGSAAMHP